MSAPLVLESPHCQHHHHERLAAFSLSLSYAHALSLSHSLALVAQKPNSPKKSTSFFFSTGAAAGAADADDVDVTLDALDDGAKPELTLELELENAAADEDDEKLLACGLAYDDAVVAADLEPPNEFALGGGAAEELSCESSHESLSWSRLELPLLLLPMPAYLPVGASPELKLGNCPPDPLLWPAPLEPFTVESTTVCAVFQTADAPLESADQPVDAVDLTLFVSAGSEIVLWTYDQPDDTFEPMSLSLTRLAAVVAAVDATDVTVLVRKPNALVRSATPPALDGALVSPPLPMPCMPPPPNFACMRARASSRRRICRAT